MTTSRDKPSAVSTSELARPYTEVWGECLRNLTNAIVGASQKRNIRKPMEYLETSGNTCGYVMCINMYQCVSICINDTVSEFGCESASLDKMCRLDRVLDRVNHSKPPT